MEHTVVTVNLRFQGKLNRPNLPKAFMKSGQEGQGEIEENFRHIASAPTLFPA